MQASSRGLLGGGGGGQACMLNKGGGRNMLPGLVSKQHTVEYPHVQASLHDCDIYRAMLINFYYKLSWQCKH